MSFAAKDILDPRSWLGVESYVIAPGFLASGTTADVAAIIMKEPVTGITPQALPPAGLLDALSSQQLRRATFTVVGYGMDQNFAHPGDRQSGTAAYKQFYKRWLGLAPQPTGICFMDSGGPAFLNLGGTEYMVGAAIRLRDADCTRAFFEQRLDTPDALSFLQTVIRG